MEDEIDMSRVDSFVSISSDVDCSSTGCRSGSTCLLRSEMDWRQGGQRESMRKESNGRNDKVSRVLRATSCAALICTPKNGLSCSRSSAVLRAISQGELNQRQKKDKERKGGRDGDGDEIYDRSQWETRQDEP